MASSGRLKPGEKGNITTTVDVRGKLGNISKTIQVHSNDPKRPQVTLALKMDVKDEMHSKKYNADKIFAEPCSSCHIEAGRSKKLLAFFDADCSMCHNYGKTASPLNAMKDMPKDKLRKAIEEGIEGSSMPGWSTAKSGPMTSEEIDSLVEFIKGR